MEIQNQQALRTGTPAPEAPENAIDLEELALRLLAGWKLIITLALVSAIAAGYYVMRIVTPMYRATSAIYIQTASDSVVKLSDLQVGSALANDYLEVFSMWEIHDEVITNLGLNRSYASMKGALSVTNPSNTRILRISFTSSSAQEAAIVANEYAVVASNYIENVMSTEKPNIMSVARVPAAPISPNKPRMIALGFAAGFIVGCGLITLQFLLDDKIKSSSDVRKYTGLATLATIPLDTPSSRKAKEDRNA